MPLLEGLRLIVGGTTCRDNGSLVPTKFWESPEYLATIECVPTRMRCALESVHDTVRIVTDPAPIGTSRQDSIASLSRENSTVPGSAGKAVTSTLALSSNVWE